MLLGLTRFKKKILVICRELNFSVASCKVKVPSSSVEPITQLALALVARGRKFASPSFRLTSGHLVEFNGLQKYLH